MNEKWQPVDICLIIMTLTIPFIILALVLARFFTKEPIPQENAAIMADLLKVLCGGVLGVIGGRK